VTVVFRLPKSTLKSNVDTEEGSACEDRTRILRTLRAETIFNLTLTPTNSSEKTSYAPHSHTFRVAYDESEGAFLWKSDVRLRSSSDENSSADVCVRVAAALPKFPKSFEEKMDANPSVPNVAVKRLTQKMWELDPIRINAQRTIQIRKVLCVVRARSVRSGRNLHANVIVRNVTADNTVILRGGIRVAMSSSGPIGRWNLLHKTLPSSKSIPTLLPQDEYCIAVELTETLKPGASPLLVPFAIDWGILDDDGREYLRSTIYGDFSLPGGSEKDGSEEDREKK